MEWLIGAVIVAWIFRKELGRLGSKAPGRVAGPNGDIPHGLPVPTDTTIKPSGSGDGVGDSVAEAGLPPPERWAARAPISQLASETFRYVCMPGLAPSENAMAAAIAWDNVVHLPFPSPTILADGGTAAPLGFHVNIDGAWAAGDLIQELTLFARKVG